MTLEDTRTHEELARMDGEAENAAERMWQKTGREDVMSDRDRADRYKTLLEDARAENAALKARVETLEKALRLWQELLDEEGNVVERYKDQQSIAIETMEATLNPQQETPHA